MKFDGSKDTQSVKSVWSSCIQSLKRASYPTLEGNKKGCKPNLRLLTTHNILMITSLELLKTKYYQEQNYILFNHIQSYTIYKDQGQKKSFSVGALNN